MLPRESGYLHPNWILFDYNKVELIQGDLVFFSTVEPSRINHVGIYLGAGDFIHASSGYGRVKVNSLEDSYYNLRYRGARRVLNNLVI